MVRIFVAVTDRNWFDFLSAIEPDEANFWAPSGSTNFKALEPGELFLFKLHAPANFIVGGGVFSHASNVPLSLAWEAFGTKNGADSLDEMRSRIGRYRAQGLGPRLGPEPTIGCRILTSPFFWPEERWLAVSESWSPNIVVGKGFSTDDADGKYLWSAVLARTHASLEVGPDRVIELPRFGSPCLVPHRLGQGTFRLQVTDAYQRRCAVSGERTLPILDAAHIRSYAEGGAHQASNGLLLRTDIHRLFDLGYVTVDEDHRFVVSARLKADFDNGKRYYELHGSDLRPPRVPAASPSAEALAWHRENKFLS